jgi:glucose dehydrogenase
VLALTRVSGAYQRSALSWWNLVLGVWTIISPWVFRVDPASPAVNNNVITGLIIGALAIWSALATSSDMRTQNPNFSR